MEVTRSLIVATARSWIGTPYRLTGRDKAGIDCCNFPAAVYHQLGLIDAALPAYRRIEEPELLRLITGMGLKRIGLRDARDGDTIVFRAYAWRCHPTIISGDNVIHCPASPVVEQRLSSVGGRAIAAYRPPGVTN